MRGTALNTMLNKILTLRASIILQLCISVKAWYKQCSEQGRLVVGLALYFTLPAKMIILGDPNSPAVALH